MMKKKETEKIARLIEKAYILNNGGKEKLDEISYRNMINILVFDSNNNEIYNFNKSI